MSWRNWALLSSIGSLLDEFRVWIWQDSTIITIAISKWQFGWSFSLTFIWWPSFQLVYLWLRDIAYLMHYFTVFRDIIQCIMAAVYCKRCGFIWDSIATVFDLMWSIHSWRCLVIRRSRGAREASRYSLRDDPEKKRIFLVIPPFSRAGYRLAECSHIVNGSP
jgi:hypothetical protein